MKLPPPSPSPQAPAEHDAVSPVERAMLREFDAQRRLGLLRLIVPPLLVLVLLALPFAIQADLASHAMTSTAQTAIGLVGFAVAFVALLRRRVNLASVALFIGLTGVIVYLLLSAGPLRGAIDVAAVPEFALLVLPIAVSGIFGAPRFVLASTAATALFTLLLLSLTPHSQAFADALATSDGMALYTVPLATQLAFGILMFAATRGSRRMQRELGSIRVAYAREKELDRLKDQFISSVNHELRTPIMSLQGYLALALELGNRGEHMRQEQMLQRGAEAADHLASLVKSALNVRRIESDTANLKAVPFALLPAVARATHLLDPREAGDQERPLRLHVPETLAALGDEERVQQVLLNLLSNACKYSPHGSPVEVSARVVRPEPPARQWGRRAEVQPAMVEVAVRDYGKGIPPDQAVLLFQRFVRLERDIASSTPGTGLGLAISKAYVETMGGQIWIESSGVPGEGTCFRFTLPMAE